MEPCHVIAEVGKDQHERQRIFAAGKGDQDLFIMREQFLIFDAAFDFTRKKSTEVFGAKTSMMAGQGNNSGIGTAGTFHMCDNIVLTVVLQVDRAEYRLDYS